VTGSVVTGRATPPHPALRVLAGQYRQFRAAHPVRVLGWLRNGMLLAVAAAALLYVWVAIQAGHDISAARRTSQGITDIENARTAARMAEAALSDAFATEDITLTGTGSAYVNEISQVNKYLALAAEDNAAGAEGTSMIQFVQGQLGTYLQLSENAVRDYGVGRPLGQAAETYAASGEGDLLAALHDLKGTEQAALRAQRGAWALDPGTFWWALLGPVTGMFLLGGATAQVLARHFRRHVSPPLWGALLVTAAVSITMGFFNWNDARHLAAGRWAGHPVTLTAALLLSLAAAVLAYLAYRPRLAEYKFRPS
jgi:hypothetical protein